MKKSFPLAALAIPCLVAFAGCRGFSDRRPDAGRTNAVSLSGAWEFRHPGEAWRAVEVPHDWAIEGPFDPNGDEDTGKLPWRGRGEYRRTFNAAALAPGERAFLEFDGVMASPKVKLNGRDVGGWDYGYASFRLDVTDAIRPGANLVEVSADTTDHKSRWYPGAGIYRDVRLAVFRPGDADPATLFITTESVDPEKAVVRIRYTTFAGEKVDELRTIASPRRWDIDDPHLYRFDLPGRTVRFGIRTIEMKKEGLFLNGRRVQLKGVNLHADLGPLGMAFNRSAMRRQLEIMKEMGVNALRTSHNCPDPQVLELCDEMGILVWDECFDKWDGTAGRRDDQNLEEYVERNLVNFVRRDRNHPSVFCFSTGNEIAAQPVSKNPNDNTVERSARFCKAVRAEDPTRPVAMGCCWVDGVEHGVFDPYDLCGWNYRETYQTQHARSPEKPLVYSESASALSGYGEYRYRAPEKYLYPGYPQVFFGIPYDRPFKFDIGEWMVDSWDATAATWSDIPDVEFMRMERDRAFVAGDFVWTGIDYLGEPAPYTSGMFAWLTNNCNYVTRKEDMARSSYFGIADLCAIPKDRYYLYRAHWNDRAETVHVVPGCWNWQEGEKLPVFVYASGDEAELFVNGKSLGRRRKGSNQARSGIFAGDYYAVCDRYRLMWFDVPFEPGEVKAVAYRAGRKIGEATVRTCSKPVAVKLTPERKDLPADGETLAFVQVDVVDAAGTRDARASNRVSFALSGPGRIVAVGNGNARGHDSFKAVGSHPLYRGKAVAIVRRERGATEPVTLTATAEGLAPASVTFK